MFDFLKKKKKKEEDNISIRRENVSCICTMNKYLNHRCTIEFKEDKIRIIYENGEIEVFYDNVKSYGKIDNSKYGIKEAMDKNILSQGVLQSPGFLAGSFYTLVNQAKVFLYIKFKEENDSIQTFLAEYNSGVEKVIKLLDNKKKHY